MQLLVSAIRRREVTVCSDLLKAVKISYFSCSSSSSCVPQQSKHYILDPLWIIRKEKSIRRTGSVCLCVGNLREELVV